jgi:hypothetical protein
MLAVLLDEWLTLAQAECCAMHNVGAAAVLGVEADKAVLTTPSNCPGCMHS